MPHRVSNKPREALRVLLLQIRNDSVTRLEELTSFATFCGLNEEQFSVLNVFDQPHFEPEVIDKFDAVLVGGSSDASVLEPIDYPFVPDAAALLRYCIDIKMPTFCSCFGHQLAVVALGGEVIRDETDYEMGTIPISLTAAAQTDPLFHDTTNPFYAVSVHRERAPEIPENCTLLAETAPCSHSFKVNNAPFWTTQFHPEVDRQVLIDRLSLYAHKYTQNSAQLHAVLSSAVETPESNALLRKFIDRVVLAAPANA
ncbi:type 1 glutamine amidotransferase [Corallincola luteus]|uniref:Type 1 glutamine amidotransferase n=1 Tax=Corallincola luteus TaxID=1775177 RepID=A0ABY2ARY8_9GAMM|nr:type 1 glutamine amidotransferase [Corallincola luteus]TCI04732.1 type 1 glutamine amidotransferase [Corallincola luteus]